MIVKKKQKEKTGEKRLHRHEGKTVKAKARTFYYSYSPRFFYTSKRSLSLDTKLRPTIS